MIKLIKLEFKRNDFKPYIYGVLGIFIFTICIGTLFSAIPKIEQNTPAAKIFNDENMIVMMISIISMSGFSILSSIMHTKFIINEYTTNKNILLFTYPQKRNDIFMAKFSFIFIFTFVMMILSNLLSILLINVIGNLTNISKLYYNNISTIIFISIILGFIANLISTISLRIGFYKKSIIATILPTIILIAPIGNSIMLLKLYFIHLTMPIFVILIFINIILIINLLKKIGEMECLQ